MSNSMFGGHKTLEDNKNALVKDLKGVVGDADKLLNQLVNSTSDEYANARSKKSFPAHAAPLKALYPIHGPSCTTHASPYLTKPATRQKPRKNTSMTIHGKRLGWLPGSDSSSAFSAAAVKHRNPP